MVILQNLSSIIHDINIQEAQKRNPSNPYWLFEHKATNGCSPLRCPTVQLDSYALDSVLSYDIWLFSSQMFSVLFCFIIRCSGIYDKDYIKIFLFFLIHAILLGKRYKVIIHVKGE